MKNISNKFPALAKGILLIALCVSLLAITTTYGQVIVETPPAHKSIDIVTDKVSHPVPYRYGGRLSSVHRHLMPPLSQDERRRMDEPRGFEVIGVVRELPSPFSGTQADSLFIIHGA